MEFEENLAFNFEPPPQPAAAKPAVPQLPQPPQSQQQMPQMMHPGFTPPFAQGQMQGQSYSYGGAAAVGTEYDRERERDHDRQQDRDRSRQWNRPGEQHQEICRFFLKGTCVKGAACNYRHVLPPGMPLPPQRMPPGMMPPGMMSPMPGALPMPGGPAMQLGAGAGVPQAMMRPGHRREKAVVCKHWLRGLCKKGDMCEFLHEYARDKMPECYFFSKYGECSNPECPYLHIKPEEKMKECPWYARGFCKHGPRCRHRHIKKPPCEHYLLGFCPDGPNCKFGQYVRHPHATR
eukprot:TRINITY_DN1479_c2_g1_i1.p1 TRINITY_DN1479_c2_g1~~TRINITY_DN1479_c2_g1_i1.p1  ORF type:complete len:310 (-),score=77.11 TRINITY_DN1479_c2_g1_i1:8-880(-)